MQSSTTQIAEATLHSVRLVVKTLSPYVTRLARNPSEVRAAQALRFTVFNLELNEGLEKSAVTGLDADPFDDVCDHLIVEHVPTGEIVGTYRLQTGPSAAKHRGYYSEQEFDFRPFEPMRSEIVELGRACVHQQHRNLVVLGLLWKGITSYALERGGHYLCGCSSLTSQDPSAGASVYSQLSRRNLAPLPWRTFPHPIYHCSLEKLPAEPSQIPKLMRAYFSIGAKICGPPAIDREFKTIDFFTLVDLQTLPRLVRERFLE
ncbi:MAG: hemolysin [Pedosphaera sp.]|nr:hemolysin [Pedosphaera sp.]